MFLILLPLHLAVMTIIDGAMRQNAQLGLHLEVKTHCDFPEVLHAQEMFCSTLFQYCCDYWMTTWTWEIFTLW